MKKLSFLNNIISELLWMIGTFQYKIDIISNNPNPDQIKKNIIYIVGNENYVKWAYLKCPSMCGDVIMLSLIQATKPSWTIRRDKLGRPSIYPSIHKLDGCKSHFWIRRGMISLV